MPARELVSIVIITRNRPQMVRDCLDHLMRQTRPPDEIIVVDSSTGEETQTVLEDYPQVTRLRIPDGRRNMPQARNLGIGRAQGEIIAFLDDDSMAEPDWLEYLLEPYADPAVGGVGGRIIDVLEAARANPADGRIGICHKNGFTTTNFASDPGHVVEVNHVRGCNMSFRRAALAKIGGFDPRYIGSNVCEETDVCLGVTLAGWKLMYQPSALVNHLAAPRRRSGPRARAQGSRANEPSGGSCGRRTIAVICFSSISASTRRARATYAGGDAVALHPALPGIALTDDV